MKRLAIGLSCTLAALVGIGAIASIEAKPPELYMLTLDVDGQARTVDFNLSRADCGESLVLADQWTQGRSQFHCRRQLRPIATGAK